MHAKDIDWAQQCVAVGTGIVNIKDCVEHLKSVGYDGVLSVETEGGDNFDSVIALAKKSFDYLNSLL